VYVRLADVPVTVRRKHARRLVARTTDLAEALALTRAAERPSPSAGCWTTTERAEAVLRGS